MLTISDSTFIYYTNSLACNGIWLSVTYRGEPVTQPPNLLQKLSPYQTRHNLTTPILLKFNKLILQLTNGALLQGELVDLGNYPSYIGLSLIVGRIFVHDNRVMRMKVLIPRQTLSFKEKG